MRVMPRVVQRNFGSYKHGLITENPQFRKPNLESRELKLQISESKSLSTKSAL